MDVPEGQTQDLVLAELPVGGVGGQEPPQLVERSVHVLLPPALATVGEDPPHDPRASTCGQERGGV